MLNEVLLSSIDAYGNDSMKVAKVLNDIGEICRLNKEGNNAKRFYENAIEIYNNLLLKEHLPDRIKEIRVQEAKTLKNLGLFYLSIIDNYKDTPRKNELISSSIKLFIKSIEIRESELGPLHSDVSQPLNHLAKAYTLQKKYKEAENAIRKALHIREIKYGHEHPKLIEILENSALIFRKLHQEDDAIRDEKKN